MTAVKTATPASKPPALRPGLMIALAVTLGLTIWQATRMGDDDLAPRKRAGRAPAPPAVDAPAAAPLPGAAPAPRLRSALAGAADNRADATEAMDKAVQQLALASGGLSARGDFSPLSDTGRKAWSANLPPPPPPVPPPPPPPPMAPPFPYQMVGRWEEAAAAASGPAGAKVAMAVIAGPQNTWVLKAGDVLEGQWRVDAVNASAMQLTYLPLTQTQTVSMKR